MRNYPPVGIDKLRHSLYPLFMLPALIEQEEKIEPLLYYSVEELKFEYYERLLPFFLAFSSSQKILYYAFEFPGILEGEIKYILETGLLWYTVPWPGKEWFERIPFAGGGKLEAYFYHRWRRHHAQYYAYLYQLEKNYWKPLEAKILQLQQERHIQDHELERFHQLKAPLRAPTIPLSLLIYQIFCILILVLMLGLVVTGYDTPSSKQGKSLTLEQKTQLVVSSIKPPI
ncbi:MAG: hypothetical protein WDW19_03885 [Neisseriaceae bacterium]